MTGPVGERVEALPKNTTIRVVSGTELVSLGVSFFHSGNNTIDLEPFRGLVAAKGTVKLTVVNKARDPREYRFQIKYTTCNGSVLVDDKTDTVKTVIESITAKKAICHQLRVWFENMEGVHNVRLVPTSTVIEGDWLQNVYPLAERSEDGSFLFYVTDVPLEYYRLSAEGVEPRSNVYYHAVGFASS